METLNKTLEPKTDELFKETLTGYIAINEKKLNPEYKYCVVGVTGNCLDSDLSPVKIKDGDKILTHQISLTEWDIINNVNKIVWFVLDNGNAFVKQLVYWDGLSWGIRVKMFIPEESTFFVPLKNIKALFVVDEVLDPEYVKQYTQKI